ARVPAHAGLSKPKSYTCVYPFLQMVLDTTIPARENGRVPVKYNLWFRIGHARELEEDRFVVTLNVNVQDQAFAVAFGNDGFGTIPQSHDGGIIFQTGGVWDIGAGVQFIQQPACKDDDMDECRLAFIGWAWLHSGEVIPSHVVCSGEIGRA